MGESKDIGMHWKVNTPQLLAEIMTNNKMGIMHKPLTIFSRILAQVGERAAEINDPQLNALMCRLAIYSVADPYSEDYDQSVVDAILESAEKHRLESADAVDTIPPRAEADAVSL